MGFALWVLVLNGFLLRGPGLLLARHLVVDGAGRRQGPRDDPVHGLRRSPGSSSIHSGSTPPARPTRRRRSSTVGPPGRPLDRDLVLCRRPHRRRPWSARGQHLLDVIGVALGFGFLWPRRFATNPRDVPYPVIPLAVIGLDMIVATLPLAGLLVYMIAESFDNSLGVDPLFAKNILYGSATWSSTCCSSPRSRSTTTSCRGSRFCRSWPERRSRSRGRSPSSSTSSSGRTTSTRIHPRGLGAGRDQHGDAAAHLRDRDPPPSRSTASASRSTARTGSGRARRPLSSSASSAGSLAGLSGVVNATIVFFDAVVHKYRSGSSATSTRWRC